MSQFVHPDILSALVITRTRPEHRPRSLISSLALFSATRSGEAEVRFALHHAFFDATHTRVEIIGGLAERLPQASELLVWHTVSPVQRRLRAHRSGDLFPSDAELVLRQRPDITLLPLHTSGAQLREAAADIAIQLSDSTLLPLRLQRLAALQAQALWALYVRKFCPADERKALFAAYRAWRVIEDARGRAR
ncbi:hypothetical protein C0V72_14880 [Porphyrobacter sp. TH134]|uniref:hypothetical protein n=1 Tax=Porphyrobacter sp. TH134 TaxID=2067450 RepID=UPI000C7B3A6A|nr:hypothetical protein [Porphyrobacter sp. TH134]PLK22440.1 hypothetical protein C0V72_14880 [Porphyrobacter sp. TH134]